MNQEPYTTEITGRCFICSEPATLPSPGGPVCEDHWYKLIGEMIEQHPIGPKYRRDQGNSIQPSV